MKRIFALIIVVILVQNLSGQAWKQRANFPGDGRSSASSFSFSDYGFIGLGYDGADFRRSFYAYDPVYNSWNQVSSMGGVTGEGLERNVAAAFTIGTKGYVGTGQGGASFLNDFWEYDYLTDIWTIKASFGGTTRRSAVGFTINGKGYIGLGQDGSGYKKDLWEYDTTANAWTQKADFGGNARRLAVAFAFGNKAWVGTGDDGAFTNDWWEYDQPSNSWFPRDDFPGSPRYGATGFELNGKGYLACGYDTTLMNRDDFWEYDTWTDSWTQMPDFPGGKRANAIAFKVDTLAFFGMGYDTSFYYDIWLWGDTTEIIQPDTTEDAIFNPDLFEGGISIYPNPVAGQTTISLELNDFISLSDVSIFDMNGVDVTNNCELYLLESNHKNSSIKLLNKTLPPGNYFVRVRHDQYFTSGKFILLN